MLKKLKYLIILFCLCFSFLLFSCSNNNDENVSTGTYRHDKTAVYELSDGWYFYCDFEEVYNNDGTYLTSLCSFDGMNLKYQNLSDFNIALINSDTGEITGYVTPTVNCFSMNADYYDKLSKITDYLKNRKSKEPLSENELSFVDIDGLLFNKKDVVNVYNTAMKNVVNSNDFGKYSYISFSDIRKGAQLGNYHWQVGYVIFSGNIAAVNIELIYSDGKYLSNIDASKLTETQSELISEIEKAENHILQYQTFIPTEFDFNKTIDEVDFNKLHTILNSIEVENETNRNKINSN